MPKQFVGKEVKCRECGLAFPVSAPFPADAVPKVAPPKPAPPPVVEEIVALVENATTGIKVECAVCGLTGRVPESTAGRRFRCGKCGCVQHV